MWKLSKLFQCCSPAPHQPHPSPFFCDTTPLHPFRTTLWDVPSPSPLSRTHPPPCLRSRCAPPLPFYSNSFLFFLFFFSLIPTDILLLSIGTWDPPLAGKREGVLSPIFHTCLPRPSPTHKHEVHAGLSFFSFSFHLLTAPLLSHPHALLLAPSSRIALCRVTLALTFSHCLLSHVASCHMSPLVMCRPVATCCPLPHVAPCHVSPLSRRPIATRCPCPCHVAQAACLASSSLTSDLQRKWRGVSGWGGSAGAGSRIDHVVDYLCSRLSIQSNCF